MSRGRGRPTSPVGAPRVPEPHPVCRVRFLLAVGAPRAPGDLFPCAGPPFRVPGPSSVGGRCPTRAGTSSRVPDPSPDSPGSASPRAFHARLWVDGRQCARSDAGGSGGGRCPCRSQSPPDSRRPCPARHCLSSGCPGALLVGFGPGPGPGRGRGVRLLCSSVLPGCQGAPQPSMTVEALGAWSLQSSSTRWNKRWSRHLPAILM